jgi:hypothetical protein
MTDLIDGHVHPDEPLVRHLVRALLPEAEGRINVLQQLHGFRVMDGAAETEKTDSFKGTVSRDVDFKKSDKNG